MRGRGGFDRARLVTGKALGAVSDAAIADSAARGKVGPRADRKVGNTQAGEGPTNPSLMGSFIRTKQCAARIVNSLGSRRQGDRRENIVLADKQIDMSPTCVGCR